MAAAGTIGRAVLVGALIGCAQRPDHPAREKNAGTIPAAESLGTPLLGRFAGVLPCADCSGIHMELRLYAEQPSAHPVRYESSETYLGTPHGDRSVQQAGRWTILRGSGSDPDATVYQLDYDRPGAQRNFLRVGNIELRLLDRNQDEIASPPVHSLFRVPSDTSMEALTLLERDSSRVVDVARGQTIIVRLSSNRSTGYRWTMVPSTAGLLTVLREPVYTPRDSSVGGVGRVGVEAWSFLAGQSGRYQLRLEYRRPWEPHAVPAKSLTYTIAVR
jgi:inhibitor of cysteine peptidase